MAKIGLGEITPIKLQLTRENFNALIGRHSQPIRWLSADKCPNIKANQKHDENCSFCNGRGVSYNPVTQSYRVETIKAPIDGIINQAGVIWVRDFQGNEYAITSQDCVAYVSGVKKGRDYQVKYLEDITKSGTGIAEYISDGIYRVDIPTTIAFGEVQGELISLSASVSGIPLTVTGLFRNYFYISDTILSTDQVDIVFTYTDPFQFALLNNELQKEDQKFLSEIGGQGILIFPQRWEINEKDVIVALNASVMEQQVIRSTGDIDSLSAFYISELKRAYSVRSGIKVEFIPGIDFIEFKGNQIKWISANKPVENESVSITYSFCMVYKVLKDFPNPRTSESNRFPRKVALQEMAGFNSREGF